MKKILPVLIILFLTTSLQAQYTKIIIQFKDKGSNTFSIANPSQYLSQRALQRRTKYNIAIDSTDLPITKRYIDSIRLAGDVNILSASKWLNQVLIQAADSAALSKIRSFPFVKSAQPVGLRIAVESPVPGKFVETVTPLIVPATSRTAATTDYFDYGSSYGQVHIHEGEFLHNKGFRGENVVIAMLDAGYQQYKTLSVFDSVRMNGQVLGERDFVTFDNSVNEDDAHGMYCLSIIAANRPGKMIGTAPKAGFLLLRTENSVGEYPIEEHNWVAGAEFADSAGADMITSSLGYNIFNDPAFNHTYSQLYRNAAQVTQGAALACKKGMIVTNSAGNDGSNSWKYISFPADADSVCAVGAVTPTGDPAAFSSYGFPGKVKPNVASVGVSTVIAGLNNEVVNGNGTSFSNPNLAGLIACLWQAFPAYNNMKILDAVYKSASHYTTSDDRSGFGIPNFRKAYLALKKEQNNTLYGADWMWITGSSPSQVDVRFIGQVEGKATLELFTNTGNIIAAKTFTTEVEEVYNYSFTGLTPMPCGTYSIKYTDSVKTRSVTLPCTDDNKTAYLKVYPNPAQAQFNVQLPNFNNHPVTLRVLNINGKIVEQKTVALNGSAIPVTIPIDLRRKAAGMYIIEVIDAEGRKTAKVIVR